MPINHEPVYTIELGLRDGAIDHEITLSSGDNLGRPGSKVPFKLFLLLLLSRAGLEVQLLDVFHLSYVAEALLRHLFFNQFLDYFLHVVEVAQPANADRFTERFFTQGAQLRFHLGGISLINFLFPLL